MCFDNKENVMFTKKCLQVQGMVVFIVLENLWKTRKLIVWESYL